MKNRNWLSFLVASSTFIVLVTLFFRGEFKLNSISINEFETDTNSRGPKLLGPIKVDRWYEEAESQDYKIIGSGLSEKGYITAVLDKRSGSLLVPSESCEVAIPSEIKNKDGNYFYNDTVGIIERSPYKGIHYKEGTSNTFVQTVLNSGCVHEEGEIALIKSENPWEIDCEVEIKYKHLGC